MSWQKRSEQPANPDEYICFFIEDGVMKLEFGVDNIHLFIDLADSIINGKVRQSIISMIHQTMSEAGCPEKAEEFLSKIDSSIKPSEYSP